MWMAPSQERVPRLRDCSGLRAQQLARLFGVSRRSVNHWFSGKPKSGEHEAGPGRRETAIG